jgi:3-deoxy-manno-octulosonate cytidylyltransferase (CMP-KDO synthetase)
VVKVITDKQGRALYFSRSPVPGWHRAEAPRTTGAEVPSWLHHIGIYAYRREFLATFTSLPPGELEKRERLEQLRALENGYRIQSLETDHDYAGIDTEEEYQAFVARYRATTS